MEMDSPGRTRVLLVDDDLAFGRVASRVLLEEGVDCTAVETGGEAISQLSSHPFDVVLCDLALPPPDGFAIVEHARELAERPEVVVVTGMSQGDRALEPLRSAGCPILFKPMDSAELSRTIAWVMHSRYLRRGDSPRSSLESLYKLAALAASDASSLPALLDRILALTVTSEGGDSGVIKLLSGGTPRALTLAASCGPEDALGPLAAVCEWVAQTRRPLRLAGSLAAYPQFSSSGAAPVPAESILAPIVSRSDVLGVICVSSSVPGRLGPEKVAPLCATADIVSSVLVRHHADRVREHQDRLAILGQLSAGIVHELNNPLTYVKANVSTLREMLAEHRASATPVDDLLPELEELLSDVGEGVLRMEAIISSTRAAARKPAGVAAEVDLNALLRRAEVLVQPQYKHRVKLTVALGERPLVVRADEGRILQVVMNLLVNAGQAVGPGGEVTLRAGAAGGAAVVEVVDNGPGIPEEVAAQLFEPFFTTKPEGEGTGLGLSISRQIAVEHGGDLAFTTRVGGGTCFTLRLPLLAAAPAAGAARLTVLAVEDEAALLNAVKRVLSGTFEVLAAGSGPEALQLAEGKTLALILTDYSMPGQDGVSLVQALRQRGHTAPAVLLTANAEHEEVLAAVRSKLVAAVIAKPWSPRALLGDVVRLSSPPAGSASR